MNDSTKQSKRFCYDCYKNDCKDCQGKNCMRCDSYWFIFY